MNDKAYEYSLIQARLSIKKIIDENILFRSAASALGIYDKAIQYLPELLLIISENERGSQILDELGIDEFDEIVKMNGR